MAFICVDVVFLYLYVFIVRSRAAFPSHYIDRIDPPGVFALAYILVLS
jgi:hypothetical protein